MFRSEAPMYIDPIHAGPVALAHALALAARAHTQSDDSGHPESPDAAPRWRRFRPLQRLAKWWQQLDEVDGPTSEPVQLMLLSEPAGRPYATALSGLPLMNHIHKSRAAARQKSAESR
jgi:hypothetical protein